MRLTALVFALLCLASVAAGAQSVPYLGGDWKLDRDATTEDMRWNRTTNLHISQSEDDIRFDYYDGRHLLGSDVFVADGHERPRYVTRIERAYARARWNKSGLEILTRSFLDLEGYRSYSMSDRWEISADGQQLVDKSSDGKVMVFTRMRDANPKQ